MTGVAVNVTAEPEQVGLPPALSAIVTAGVTIAFTVMVIALDVAVDVLRQVALDVITQVTICPLVNDEEVNVALLAPAFVPFTFH